MDSKGKEMMYCPMKFNIHCYYGDDLPGDCPAGKTWECEKEKCAWWVKEHNRCAVLALSLDLMTINENLAWYIGEMEKRGIIKDERH